MARSVESRDDEYTVTAATRASAVISEEESADSGENFRTNSTGVRFPGNAVTSRLRLSGVQAMSRLRTTASDTFRNESSCRSQIHNLACPRSQEERKAKPCPS